MFDLAKWLIGVIVVSLLFSVLRSCEDINKIGLKGVVEKIWVGPAADSLE